MERALFDAVQQKLTDQWTTRTSVRNPGDEPSGLLRLLPPGFLPFAGSDPCTSVIALAIRSRQ
jgi:hypothetical protein